MDESVKQSVALAFATDHGRITLSYLEQFAHMDEDEFLPDPRKMDYLAGRRSVIREIKRIIKEVKEVKK